MASPIGADPGPSHMDPDEEAGTAASPDHIIERLQSLEAAYQLRNNSVLPVVVNIRSGVVHCVVGDPSNPATWQTRCGSAIRYADSRESPVDCGICLCRFVPSATHPLSSTSAGAKGGNVGCKDAPLQSHTWPKTRKRVGRVGEMVQIIVLSQHR